ncbi:cytochrome c [Paracoccus caeni]|uniref:Cytochrome c n=1 Tax=Paracoccus caeni TaxID=657651 RepID=A0A934SCM3_9RHOB|nr:cytochrome c [Paracoccus caeni]
MKTAILSASLAIPLPLFAQDADDAIEARHGYMKMLSIEMGKLSGMAKGEIEYDEAAAQAAANNLAALSNYDLPSLFVEGSSSDDNGDSDALPAIWQNTEDFGAKFAGFREAAAAAPAAVTGGQGNIGAALQTLGGACKDCHDDYRKPD